MCIPFLPINYKAGSEINYFPWYAKFDISSSFAAIGKVCRSSNKKYDFEVWILKKCAKKHFFWTTLSCCCVICIQSTCIFANFEKKGKSFTLLKWDIMFKMFSLVKLYLTCFPTLCTQETWKVEHAPYKCQIV